MSLSQNNSQPSLNSQQEGEQQNSGTDDQMSVYMRNNLLMRRIQIEGDEREFLMDPNGQIFDMNGQFIGTANTNELEELGEGQQQQEGIQNDGQDNGNEEMMLLDDEDDDVQQMQPTGAN